MKKKALRILKTVGSGVLALMLALAFFGCVTAAPKEETPTDETALASTDAPKKIGIIQLTEHPALSAAREGFVQALADNGYIDGENITINSQIGSGDVSALTTIADQLIGDDSDLILAIATPAAQAVVGKTQTIPVLGTAITDYVVAGLIESNEAPGRNVSGTTDMNPVEQQI
ncbi:MAG: ABC transporter substrate-binding protein, partial [Coriobacteriales bacterium]|nr:ABC transporter substrate-binding protein [Coriobacteriales bacterium]